jgi:hypothetical protein
VELLKALAAASRRYLLVQYKTLETFKGRFNVARATRKSRIQPHGFCTDEQIREELSAANLNCLLISKISYSSDRVFVLAEKTDGACS